MLVSVRVSYLNSFQLFFASAECIVSEQH